MVTSKLVASARLESSQRGLSPFVYDIAGVSSGIAALCSDDSLHVLDGSTLKSVSNFKNWQDGVCQRLKLFAADTIVTAGAAGKVRIRDLRSKGAISEELQLKGQENLLCVDVNPGKNQVAVGTELVGVDAKVVIWDIRQSGDPCIVYNDSHSENVTDLCFAQDSSLLLSGSDDGIVNLFDTTISDEDEAVVEAFNFVAGIQSCQFIDDTNNILTLTQQATLHVNEYNIKDKIEGETWSQSFGDLREKLNVKHVVSALQKPVPTILTDSINEMQLHRLRYSERKSKWKLDREILVFPEAHGPEIGRAVYVSGNRVYTGGEDGIVKAWSADIDWLNKNDHPKKRPKLE